MINNTIIQTTISVFTGKMARSLFPWHACTAILGVVTGNHNKILSGPWTICNQGKKFNSFKLFAKQLLLLMLYTLKKSPLSLCTMKNHTAAILNNSDFPDSYPLNKIYYFGFSCKYTFHNWETLRDGGLLKSKFSWLKCEGTIFHLQQQTKETKLFWPTAALSYVSKPVPFFLLCK